MPMIRLTKYKFMQFHLHLQNSSWIAWFVNTLCLKMLDVYAETFQTSNNWRLALERRLRLNVLLDVTFRTGLHNVTSNLHIFFNIEDKCF